MFILVLVEEAKDNHIHGKIAGEPFLPRNQYKVMARNSISFGFITCANIITISVRFAGPWLLVQLVFLSSIRAHIVFILVLVKDAKHNHIHGNQYKVTARNSISFCFVTIYNFDGTKLAQLYSVHWNPKNSGIALQISFITISS